METKRKKIYISLPISNKEKDAQRKRAEELAHRLNCKGYDAVNPFDIADDLEEKFAVSGGKPNWFDYMSEDFHELLQCDGILMDADTRSSYGCSIELAVAQAMAASPNRKFLIFHTREQWADVKNKYIV